MYFIFYICYYYIFRVYVHLFHIYTGYRTEIRSLIVLCIVLWESGFRCGTQYIFTSSESNTTLYFDEKFLVILKAGFILYQTEMLRRFLLNANGIRTLSLRLCSTETLKPSFDAPESDLEARKSIKQNDTFEALLRNSIFVKMGDPVGKVNI